MNHIYRNVWNEITRTYVAAAEIVKGRGKSSKGSKSSKSSATADASEASVQAGGLRVTSGIAPQAPPLAAMKPAAAPQRRRLHAALPRPMALEQRFMFDGAAFGDVVTVVDRTAGDVVRHAGADRFANRAEVRAASERAPVASMAQASVPVAAPMVTSVTAGAVTGDERAASLQLDVQAPQGSGIPTDLATKLASAQAQAERQVAEFLLQPDAQSRLFEFFQGSSASAEPSAAWSEAAAALLQSLTSGGETVRVELRPGTEMPNAMGAFAAAGPDGTPVIYLNADWAAAQTDAQAIASVLVEEMGHYLDARLNGAADTAGDEGERFASALTEGQGNSTVAGWDDDHSTLSIDGAAVAVETASLNFPGTGSGSLNFAGFVIDTTRTPAAKEANKHDFIKSPSVSITNISITDAQSSRTFSGNDVSVSATITYSNSTTETVHGWISRPIKVGGQVKGFYFWSDTDFTSLSLAQTDGNMDGDSSTADNRGFVIVWDKDYFNSLTTTGGYASVGSSSDRVDTALNSLLPAQVPPVANNDTTSGTPDAAVAGRPALEQGFNSNTSTVVTAAINASGNVITNDTGGNGTLRVTNVTASAGPSSSVSSTAAGVVTGSYGTLTLNSNGSYTYVVDNALLPVDRLLTGTLNDSFTYTIGDGAGGTASATLTITVNGSNDAPSPGLTDHSRLLPRVRGPTRSTTPMRPSTGSPPARRWRTA